MTVRMPDRLPEWGTSGDKVAMTDGQIATGYSAATPNVSAQKENWYRGELSALSGWVRDTPLWPKFTISSSAEASSPYRKQLWGFGWGVVESNSFLLDPYFLDNPDLGTYDYGCNICGSTMALIKGTGAATVIYFFADYRTNTFAGSSIASTQIVATDYAPSAADTLTCARSDLFSDGEAIPHYTTGLWIAENWASSGFTGNLHELTYNEDYPPTWTLVARVSPFGGVGGDDREWQQDGIMAHYTATPAADGTLVAIGQPVAAGSWYVNTSSDKGATWGGRSALSLSASVRPILLEYSEHLGVWVLCDSYGHIWHCSGDPAAGGNWVKQDAVAAGSKVVPRDVISSCVLLGSTYIWGTYNDETTYWDAVICVTDDNWTTYRAERGWGWVGKCGQWLCYLAKTYDTNEWLGISGPIFQEVTAPSMYSP